MIIHIVLSEPTTDDGVGAFEWRKRLPEAEGAFRSLRGLDRVTRLWTNVTVPDTMTPEQVTEYVDDMYWNGNIVEQTNVWGDPELVHGAM